jgi:NADP-dependent 3-hydroxy acid dehydrogenase YdfG
MPAKPPETQLHADATYVLIGGLGGIGRAFAVEMIKYGARNLAIFSRSGASNENAKSAVEQMTKEGVTVKVFACDVGDEAALQVALAEVKETMPSVRGVIHGGLVIRNSLFQNMDVETWKDSLKVKVQGTWALHKHLPENLDFFVMLSSLVGTFGNASQAAYGAASTFQDAFANYRNGLGLAATTIDLGMVTGVGYVAERDDVQRSLRSQGFEEITPEECMAIIEYAITHPLRMANRSSLMTGVGLGKFAAGEVTGAVYSPSRWSHFRRMAMLKSQKDTEEASSELKVQDLLKKAASIDEGSECIEQALMSKMANLLMTPIEDINPSRAISEYGLDSLIAVVSLRH